MPKKESAIVTIGKDAKKLRAANKELTQKDAIKKASEIYRENKAKKK